MATSLFWVFEEKLKLAGLRKEEQERLVETRRIDNRSWRSVWIAVFLTTILIGGLAHFRYFLNFVWTPTWLLGNGISATVLFGVRMVVVAALLYLYTKLVPKTAAVRKLKSIERDRIWVILAVSFAMFFLVIALEQAGGTLNLFAKDKTQPDIFGITFPYEFYQSVNPLWVMVLSLFTMWLWPKLEKRGVRDTHKLGPGLMFVAIVFFLLQAAQAVTADGAKASPLWLIAIYGIIAAGEVCISVVGLSVVNKLAPEHMKAFFIAVFFMSIAVGGYLAGTVDQILKEIGLSPWKTLAWTCVAASVIYTLLAGKLRRLSHGVL